MVDCTGVFKTAAKLAPYFEPGSKKVIVSAPVKDGGALNIVYGINHHLYDGSQALVTAASCTTNCLAPVVKVIHDSLGIRHGSITTIHDVTNTQTIVDRPAKDMRRARSALTNLIPTTTGSATAITLIYPELAGRLNGHAVRVPLLNASLTDCVFEVERSHDGRRGQRPLRRRRRRPPQGHPRVETRPLVSSDFTNDPRSAIIDGPSTMVTNGTQVKIYAWYDNEWGYACRWPISCGWWPHRCDETTTRCAPMPPSRRPIGPSCCPDGALRCWCSSTSTRSASRRSSSRGSFSSTKSRASSPTSPPDGLPPALASR